MPASASLTDALLALANEPDWSARKRLVERHRDLLLSDDADALLKAGIVNNAARPAVQSRFELCRGILSDCRAIGVDAAFILPIGPTPGLMDALKDLLSADSPTEARHTILEHRALLLTDEADWVLAALAHETPDAQLLVDRVAHRRALLQRCRREGIAAACADLLHDERTSEVAATGQSANALRQRTIALRQARARVEHVVDSVDAAVAEAMRLRDEEGYDLFRGQRCAWPVVSSFRRLDAPQHTEAIARVNRFIHWAKTEAALQQYGFDSDQAIAIAQHYGIATTFMDFSSEIDVARFFATEHCLDAAHDSAAAAAEPSCIVAIRSADVDAWARQRFKQTAEFVGPEIVRLDVPNLWRLEAQAGCFLVDDDVLDDYPYRYILFPASIGPAPTLTRAGIYPEEKSDLELVLEQWFWHEKAARGTREMMAMLKSSGVAPHPSSWESTEGIGLKGIHRPEPHPSWSGRESTWLRETERFAAVRPGASDVFDVELRPQISVADAHALAARLLPAASLADRRRRSAEWRVRIDGAVDAPAGQQLARQWDALRIDGYSDAQVIASFAMSLALLALQRGLLAGQPRYSGSLGSGARVEPLATLFGTDLLVEFTGLVGYSRALVGAAELRAAVRDDIARYLPDDLYDDCSPDEAQRMHQLLLGIHRPNLLFDFDRFADVYVRQVVPSSVIFRPELPLYPVLHLHTFGVP